MNTSLHRAGQANFTILVYGFECGWISPITSLLQSEDSPAGYPLTDSQLSWVASVLSLTATFGVVTYSYVADQYGRKTSVVALAIVEAISWVIRLSYTSFPLLILARIFAGLTAGGGYTINTIYVKEISQKDLTGILGTFPILMHTTGIFLMYLMGAYMDYTVVIITVLVVSILTMIAMTRAPESPAFLVKQDKIEPLLIGVYGITALAMFALAIMIVFQERYGNVPAWMPAVALILSVAMFSGGVSPLAFIVTSEMFNFHIRATVMGVVVTYGWLLTSVELMTYTPIANSMGEFAPYVFYGCVNLAAVFFVAFFLPETRGKTEEEIFKNVKNKDVHDSVI
ncbi:unnamed protein product, partial [Brenthis ino]